MKLSKLLHVVSVGVGVIGVILFAVAVLGGSETLLGISKVDVLLCTGILILIAIWVQVATMHHMMLEKKGEIV